MLRVWSDSVRAGILDRHGARGTTFVYQPGVDRARAVSVAMPVRTASWDVNFGLAPIFDMNLPEGALRAHLVRSFAKATGTFDDLELLAVVGRSLIGRVRCSAPDAELSEDVPFQSVDEILKARKDGGLFDYLLDKFAVYSGLSGVQPKVMIRGAQGSPQATSSKGATHIVKFWEATEYPELAANEFFCLSVAKEIGLSVPSFALSEDGGALVVERFDLAEDGTYLGFEDFCVLNGLPASGKYRGGYETRAFKRVQEFVDPSGRERALADLFKLFVLNCAVRNGDAHLKNFGIIYQEVNGQARLAPVYDVLTTWAYIPKGPMALTLNGSTNWPDRRKLVLLGQTRANLSARKIEHLFEEIADALSKIAPLLGAYFRDRASAAEVKDRIVEAWTSGVRESLGFGDRSLVSMAS